MSRRHKGRRLKKPVRLVAQLTQTFEAFCKLLPFQYVVICKKTGPVSLSNHFLIEWRFVGLELEVRFGCVDIHE